MISKEMSSLMLEITRSDDCSRISLTEKLSNSDALVV